MDDIISELQKVEQDKLAIQNTISKAIRKHEQQLEALKAKDDDLRARLLTAMEENNVKKFENDVIRINYVAPQIRTTVDVKRLKEEAPELFTEFAKEVFVKASLRINVYES
jgi:regulator of replication initiation timing